MHSLETEKKKELIEKMTAAASEVTAIRPESFTILIQELDQDNIGLGGKTLREVIASR